MYNSFYVFIFSIELLLDEISTSIKYSIFASNLAFFNLNELGKSDGKFIENGILYYPIGIYVFRN